MSEPVIDPSEIIIDRAGTIKEDVLRANPWVRFLARFFDYGWFLLALWGGRLLLHKYGFHERFESYIPIEFLAWIPIEALLLSVLGTTPGKFFLKVKFRQGRRLKLSFRDAIKRSFNVWFRGLGMMIPVINAFCLLVAYYRLKTFQTTTWDREESISVTHAPIGRWRIVVSALFSSASLFFYFKS
jgi:hypothetical protein